MTAVKRAWKIYDDEDMAVFIYQATDAEDACRQHEDQGFLRPDDADIERFPAMDGFGNDVLVAMMQGIVGSVECPGCGLMIRCSPDDERNYTPRTWEKGRALHVAESLWCSLECYEKAGGTVSG